MASADLSIVLLTKLPVPGKVKTRLTPQLTAEQAADVTRIFLQHFAQRVKQLGELVISFDPPEALTQMRALLDGEARYVGQCAGDLGARIADAFGSLKTSHTMFFGVDSPDVPLGSIRSAIELLDRNEVVLGPCEDGGYWCLGITRAVDATALLSNIQWSSGQELRQTIDRARKLNYRVGLADSWDDVDRPADLRRLVSRLQKSDNADDAKLLEQLRFLPFGAMS